MTIARSELKQYKSATVDESSLNGGIMGAVPIVSGVINNVFPNVSKADRLAGLTTYRKTYVKNTNLTLNLIAPLAWIDIITAGDDYVCMFAGTNTDTQDDIVGTERKYGCASLQTDVTSGGSTFIVEVEDAALAVGNDAIFAAGDTIRISNKSNIDSGVGTEEEFIIDAITTTYLADPLHILVDIGTSVLANSYTVAGNTRVASIYKHGADLYSSADTAVATTVGDGTFDDTTYPIVTDNIGTTEDTITLTFTSASLFTVSSDTFGALDSGSTLATYTYTNPNFTGSTHFSIPLLGWTGTWASGDTLVFDVHPAAMALWRKRVVPAGSGSLSGNKTVLVFGGESA
jgi:dihydroxyacetone kinase DhaKLM complex PTS-EIIA-like component DhaM